MSGDDDRRAEIEAVARELKHNDECGAGPVSEEEYRADAKEIIAALDRVRDARDDDEATAYHVWIGGTAGWRVFRAEDVKPIRGDDEDCPDCWEGRPKWAGTMPVGPCPTCDGTGKRSPQDEDHEECHDPLPLAPGAVRSRCRRCGAWVEATRSPQDHETRSDA
jgi:hypothetical protein